MTSQDDSRDVALTLKESAEYLLEECRMVLPGIQALFGFQLVVVFSARFPIDLDRSMQRLHLLAIAFIACAVALIMAPAALHRQAGAGHVSRTFVRVSSRLLLCSMVPLAAGVCVDFYLIAAIMIPEALAIACGVMLLGLFVFLWFALPRLRALQRMVG